MMAHEFKLFTCKLARDTQRAPLKTVVLVVSQKVLEQKAAVQAQETEHLINTGDRLSIRFPRQIALNALSLLLRPNGYITLPHIGEERARGLSVSQLQHRLEKAYGATTAQRVGLVEIRF
jgi:protein involved in polysaccharide export with SLBB domain